MIAILLIYGTLLFFISAFVGFQFLHWFQYKKARKSQHELAVPTQYPKVTVQLPVYNERFVVARLIHSVAALDYPKEQLEIQVLDDSTDQTSDIVAKLVEEYQGSMAIQHVQRPKREGFKAGALAYGLQQCKGEFIAIFDADFVPDAQYLKRVIPRFTADNIGLVQARWGHINRDSNWLTEMQAFGLDAHFTVEQLGRNHGKVFMNFNGTAGVWRKACIEDAGGWSHDTLTEDLDLSYRAQLKGWQFVFDENLEVPAELPANIHALKSQQFRWTKGAAECLSKLIPSVLRSKNITVWQKVHGFMHLSNSFLFVAIFCCALLSIPALFIKIHEQQYSTWFNWAGLFTGSLLLLATVYATAYRRVTGDLKGFWWRFLLFLSVSMGLSLHNAIAVIEGYMGRKTPFVRTPKMGDQHLPENQKLQYVVSSVSFITWLELSLAVLFAMAAVYGAVHMEFGLMPFHIMLSVGFFYVAAAAFGKLPGKLRGAVS